MTTQTTPLPATRSNCPVAASLDLFGDRWTLLVLRDMLIGGLSQFSELGAQEGIATNILSERLQRLQNAGLITRTRSQEDRRRWDYSPTSAAVELVPALVELVLWGSRHTEGSAPEWVLEAAAADKAALVSRLTAMAAARVGDG